MNSYIRRESFLRRLLRVMDAAGYAPSEILSIHPLELAEIKGITVPEIRLVLLLQDEILHDLEHGDGLPALLEQCGWVVSSNG